MSIKLLIASTNNGKLRDFRGAAAAHGVEVELLPGIENMPEAIEDAHTFEENARKKSEHYSRLAMGEMVVADDSGLVIDALDGAPGVYSARYSVMAGDVADDAGREAIDGANNARVLRLLQHVPDQKRTGRFVCVISVARDGREIASFRGAVEGQIMRELRGTNGFGYDPLFYFPAIDKTLAEIEAQEKSKYSHRGEAFRKLLEWCDEGCK